MPNGPTPHDDEPLNSAEARLFGLLETYQAALKGALPDKAADTEEGDLDSLLRAEFEHGCWVIEQLMGVERPSREEPSTTGQAVAPPGPNELLEEETLTDRLPTSIGRFEVVRELGRGAYGVVLLVRDPVLRREVALKIPRPEALLRPSLRRRFTVEGQAVARLTHPNVVAVYEVGQAGPVCYIAAGYCNGPNLAEWLTQQRLPVPVPTAAQIVMQLADGIAYAHSRGVLHRDLKPSNVLLEAQEKSDRTGGTPGSGQITLSFTPKISDFGLARVEDLAGGETRTGLLLGTPRYMSPEQAEGRTSEIGPATDVYGLGTIPYELLTRHAVFQGASDADTLRKVVDIEPANPRRWRDDLPRDLAAICLKCLEKQPARRYPSASDLADDLRRFLSDEPTRARPIGTIRRLGKWVRRRPTAAAVAAVTLLSLIGFTAGSLLYSARITALYQLAQRHRHDAEMRQREADAQRAEAEIQRREADAQRGKADRQAKQAIQERKRAQANAQVAVTAAEAERQAKETAQAREQEAAAVLSFVSDKVFAAARPEGKEGGLGRAVTLRRAIDSSLPFVKDSFANQPLVEAKLRTTLGASYLYLGEAKIAAEQFERACALFSRHLGPDHPTTIKCMSNLAISYSRMGRLQDALRLQEKTMALAKAKLSPGDPGLFRAANTLGHVYIVLGRKKQAIEIFEEYLALAKGKLGPDHPDTRALMDNVAYGYWKMGRLQEALRLQQEMIALEKVKLGPEHPDMVTRTINLAGTFVEMGRLEEALRLQEETLRLAKAKLGPEHRDTLRCMDSLALSYGLQGRLQEACKLFEETLALKKAHLGEEDPLTLVSMTGLGEWLAALGKWTDSATLFSLAAGKNGNEESANRFEAVFGLAVARFMLGDQAGRHIACKELLDRYGAKATDERAFNIAVACLPDEHAVDDAEAVVAVAKPAGRNNPTFAVALGMAQFRAGHTLEAMATIKAALPKHSLALAIMPKAVDPIHCGQLMGELCLAMCYRKLGDDAAVISQIKKARTLVKRLEESPRTYILGFRPWGVPFTIEWAKRELAALGPKGQPAKK